MPPMTEQEQIAEFLARKGATRIAAGVSTLGEMSAREWSRAVRSPTRIHARDPISERHSIIDHMGRVRVRNGLGEWIA